jgi:hypothetical protein
MAKFLIWFSQKLLSNQFWNPLKLYSPSRAVIDPTSRDAQLMAEDLQKVQISRKLN